MRPEPPVSRLEQRFEQALFWVACAAAVLPLLVTAYPPLQDTPQHLAAIRVLHSHGDPSFGLADHFVLHPLRTQYLTYYVLADLLTHLAPLYWVNTALIAAVVVAIPWSVRSLSRALGGDGSAALLALPLTYNAQLILGFVNFLAAIPLCLFGLAWAARMTAARRADKPSKPSPTRPAIWLAVLSVLTFLTHVVPFAFLALGTGLLALRGLPREVRARLSHLAQGLWPLSPAMLVAAFWVYRSPAGQATFEAATATDTAGAGASFRPAARALEELPMWLTDVFVDPASPQLLQAFVTLFVVAAGASLVLRARPAPAPGLWLLPLMAAVLYFVAPAGYRWIWPIAPRFGLLCLLLCLPLFPAARAWVRRGLLSAAFGLCLSHATLAYQAFDGFGTEVGAFDRALTAIPPGQRVAGLIFDRGSRHVRFAPFLHFVAHYQAQKGGVVMFTFADFPQSPFSFREQRRPPPVRPRWEWTPRRVDPARDLRDYDYVLVRGGPGRIARQPRAFRRVFSAPRWSVWQRRATQVEQGR